MRILNRAHIPWFIFCIAATVFAAWLYVQNPSGYRSAGGTPLGVIFGTTAFAIFVFGGLLSLRKKVVLWRLGSLQRWMRAHIWLTLLTVPLVLFHSGFRLGGPMTTTLMVLYAIVMVSGTYGLALQHQLPHIMKERLPAETVYEQIPHIRGQLVVAAQKLRDSFQPKAPEKIDAGAPAAAAGKVTAGSTPMASTAADLSTPAARAKSVVGSTITAEPLAATATSTSPSPGSSASAEATADRPPAAITANAEDSDSEAVLSDCIEGEILPYLAASRGDKMRLGNSRYSDDLFRLLKLRVAEAYRGRVEDLQSWCDERRMLDLQVRMHHWLHGWLFVHAPVSFLLILFTAWHAYVTLLYY